MRIPLNLATRPFINTRRFVLTVVVLAAVTLLVTLAAAASAFTAWRDRTTTQALISSLNSRRSELLSEQQQLEAELRKPGTQELLGRAQFLNQLIRQKSLAWTELFFDLQEALPEGVRVLSVSPALRDDGDLQLTLRVGVQSADQLVKFLQNLESGAKFRDVVLHTQSRSQTSAVDAMVADLSAVYVQRKAQP